MDAVQPFTQVDAFTDRPFAGNPAAVCLLPAEREPAWMQLVAREMNLAETAFLLRRAAGFDLRWFTPTAEVDLCGHATLASAHALWEEGQLAPDHMARFQTRSGVLTAERRDGLIWLDFPATPPVEADAPDGLAAVLGAEPLSVRRTPFDYLVVLETEGQARSNRDRALRDRPAGLREPLLRARVRRPGGPGHRLGPLRPGPLLGGATGAARAARLSGLGPGWAGARAGPG